LHDHQLIKHNEQQKATGWRCDGYQFFPSCQSGISDFK
jgi:hypothetical protein